MTQTNAVTGADFITTRAALFHPSTLCCAHVMLNSPRAVRNQYAVGGVLVALGVLLGAKQASAAPGQGTRMAGIEAQGPASRAVTAMHHNPAMLGTLGGTAVQVAGSLGIEQLRVRRFGIDPSTGSATSDLSEPTSVVNPGYGYFVGASLYFDPITFAVGLYDLNSQLRLASADPLRFHLAPDPDRGCLNPTLGKCPPNGGAVRIRQDLTVALAFNRGIFHIGGAVHFPRLRARFAFDNDTELTPAPEQVLTARCDTIENPLCAERVGFKGWTRWIPRDGRASNLDAALTFGVAVRLRNESVVLGARYRTFPLRQRGQVELDGQSLVCRPSVDLGNNSGRDIVPPCAIAKPITATLRERLPQQVGLGAAFKLGRNENWHVDTNLYWIDYCPGGSNPARCGGRDAQTLLLVGLDRNSFVAPEFKRYRGAQDLYGLDVYARYAWRSNVSVLFGGGASSPSVRRAAQTAALGEGWRLTMNAGARVRLGSSNAVLTPGYSLDLALPRNVTGARADFDPTAASAFASSGGDLNDPGADRVLSGRARPTNAGRYFGSLHTFSLTLSWGDSSRVFE